MTWLVKPQAGSSRKRNTADDTPARSLDFRVLNALGGKRIESFAQVGACRTHQGRDVFNQQEPVAKGRHQFDLFRSKVAQELYLSLSSGHNHDTRQGNSPN